MDCDIQATKTAPQQHKRRLRCFDKRIMLVSIAARSDRKRRFANREHGVQRVLVANTGAKINGGATASYLNAVAPLSTGLSIIPAGSEDQC